MTSRAVFTRMTELDWSIQADRRNITRLAVFHKAHEGHLSIPVPNLLHLLTRPTRRTHNKSYIEIRANRGGLTITKAPKANGLRYLYKWPWCPRK